MSRKQQSDLTAVSNTVWPLNLFSDWFAHLDRKRIAPPVSDGLDRFTSHQLRDVGLECMERSGMNAMFGNGHTYSANRTSLKKM